MSRCNTFCSYQGAAFFVFGLAGVEIVDDEQGAILPTALNASRVGLSVDTMTGRGEAPGAEDLAHGCGRYLIVRCRLEGQFAPSTHDVSVRHRSRAVRMPRHGVPNLFGTNCEATLGNHPKKAIKTMFQALPPGPSILLCRCVGGGW